MSFRNRLLSTSYILAAQNVILPILATRAHLLYINYSAAHVYLIELSKRYFSS